MTTNSQSRRPPGVVELFGLPGVGKSTTVEALALAIPAGGFRTRLDNARLKPALATVFTLVIRPRRCAAVLAVGRGVAHGINGSPRWKLRRATKVALALAHMHRHARSGERLVLDEGPLNLLLAASWASEAARARTLRRMVGLYAEFGVCVVVLQRSHTSADIAQESQDPAASDQGSGLEPTASAQAAGAVKLPWEARRAQMPSAVHEVERSGVRTVHLTIGPSDAPADVATRLADSIHAGVARRRDPGAGSGGDDD